jgi:hypothetical protein
LKIDRTCQTHGSRNRFSAARHFAFRNLFGARNGKLVYAAVYFSGAANDLIELLRI